MRMLITIGLLLGVVLLGITVLNQLGATDVTAKMGEFVSAKADALSTSAKGLPGKDAGEKERARYMQNVIGWDVREIEKRKPEAVREAIRQIQAERQELNVQEREVLIIISESEDEGGEQAEELRDCRAWMDEAFNALDNPDTTYPVRVGGRTYHSENGLRAAINATGERIEALKGTAWIGPDVRIERAREALVLIRNAKEMLRRTETLLEQQLKWLETDARYATAEQASKHAKELRRFAKTILTEEEVAETGGGKLRKHSDPEVRVKDKIDRWREARP